MDKQWIAEFYRDRGNNCPVEEFIFSLPAKDQVKVARTVALLEMFGPQLRMPHSRSVEQNLFELRVQCTNTIQRVLYFHYEAERFVMVHGFTKKTQKTPARELDIARNRKADYYRQKEVKQHGQKEK